MIIFKNKGELDIRAIKTFGVNSKDNPDSAIGYFGTGLKYAIAIVLREGGSISVSTGGRTYLFTLQPTRIRHDDFDIVCMNGEELGFTTQLGKDWEMWMAMRELYSNMLDEGGEAFVSSDPHCTPTPTVSVDATYVQVTCPEMEKLFGNIGDYFLDTSNRTPIEVNDEVDAYSVENAMNRTSALGYIFYKGVRVMQTRCPALFSYNHHKGLQLTEDRTIRDSWSTLYHLAPLVTRSKNSAFIKKMVMCSEKMYEGQINYSNNSGGDIEFFLDVVGDLRKRYKDKGISTYAISLHKRERKVESVLPDKSCALNVVEKQQLDKAVNFCKNTLSLDVDDYQLIVCKDLGVDNDLGRADIAEGKMYISKQCFIEGTKHVAVAILEEYTHCKHEVLDETVQQKWIYLNQIVSLGEQLDGEPL